MIRLSVFFLLLVVGCEAPPQPSRLAPPAVDAPVEKPLFRQEVAATDDDPRLAVLLHGYGSDERDLIPIARRLGFTGRVVSLRAPLPAGRGFAWFPIDFAADGTRYAADAADDVLVRLASELAALHGTHEGELVVVGFSQGAMLAMMLAAEHPTTLDRAVALSGALPRAVRPSRETSPLFAAHGNADQVIGIERARQAQQWLVEAGMSPQFHEYPGLGHGINEDEIRDAKAWLADKQERR